MRYEMVGDVCRDLGRSSEIEWLETNGTGAFAMGTVAGVNTRRYHAHLLATLRPPVERQVVLAKVDEEVIVDGARVALGTNFFPGVVHPRGFENLESFRLDPFPVWRYRVGGITIEKSLFLVPERQIVVVQYRADRACTIEARPLLAGRDYHGLRRQGDPPAGFGLCSNAKRLHDVKDWYFNFEYPVERERGLDFQEDLYCPRAYTFEVSPEQPAYLVAAAERHLRATSDEVAQWEALRRERGAEAANDFLVKRADGEPTIIAGYPWFTDWGRDTMIALPGLLIARGRHEEARRVIRGFLAHVNQGLIPNRFPDRGEEPEYNTVDATLWLCEAVRQLPENEEFRPAVREILEWHFRGTHHGIQVDANDGLLSAGDPGTQLTWMDARIGTWAVTPRYGKAVEINALWINALAMFPEYAAERERAVANFRAKFWNPVANCLCDTLTPHGPDPSIRPNQIFAISLPEPILPPDLALSVLRVVERDLLTDYGLRTLSPRDPRYVGKYQGGPYERDSSYHQGTVWPWLMGPYLTAYLRINGRTEESLAYVRARLERLQAEAGKHLLGHIPEIYDGDAPHRAVGAPAQAWSLSELIRVTWEVEQRTASAAGS
jgi:predicted glycogen debranching enzyme